MLRIAVQSKGRLYDETMELLQESGISLGVSKRTLLVQAGNFPVEVLFLRDDDIPQSVAGGVADVGIVGENEFVERQEKADIMRFETASDRYKRLVNTQPEILRSTPLVFIASFLQMTPETLSRVRAKYLSEKK